MIPNRIVLPAAVLVLAARTAVAPARRPGRSPPPAGSLFLLLAALAYPGGLGMGDVKLALLLGAALGATLPVALMIGMLAALVPAVVLLARHGQAARKMAIPLGPVPRRPAPLVALFAGHADPPRIPEPRLRATMSNVHPIHDEPGIEPGDVFDPEARGSIRRARSRPAARPVDDADAPPGGFRRRAHRPRGRASPTTSTARGSSRRSTACRSSTSP